MVQSERVLVVPASLLHRLGHFQGFMPNPGRYMDELFSPRHTSYRPRREMEENADFKQLIPYVIFRHTDTQGQESIFRYTRGPGQGEGRLHRKRSVGIGGHIAAADAERAAGTNPYREGMQRELAEEVVIESEYVERCVGLINDDETEVGSVHLGIVHLADVERPAVRPRESEITEAGFQLVRQILDGLEQYETWSQICMRALFDPR